MTLRNAAISVFVISGLLFYFAREAEGSKKRDRSPTSGPTSVPTNSGANSGTNSPSNINSANLSIYKAALAKAALAKLPSAEACGDFKSLAGNSEFSLRELAQLRSLLVCPDSPKEFNFAEFNKPQFESLRAEAELHLAEKHGNWDHYLDLLNTSVGSAKTESEKSRMAQKGLQIAQEKKLTAQASKFEKLLHRISPRFRKNVQRAEYLEVGQDLLSAREFDKARGYLRKVIDDAKFPFENRRKAYSIYRNSYKIEHDKRNHIKESQQYYQWLMKRKEYQKALEAGLYLSRALWTDGMQAQAEKTLGDIERKLSKKTKTYEIDFIRGRMATEDGHALKAIVHYDKALSSGAKNSTMGFKIQYAKGWSLYHLAKWSEAAAEFNKALEIAKEQPDQVRARFWEARAVKKAGQLENSKALYREIIREDPLGFYGLIAYRDLEEDIPAIAAVSPTTSENILEPKHLTPEIRELLADLSFVGEKRALENLLNDLSQKGHWDWESPEGIEFLRYYAKAGLYLPLFSTLTKIPKEMREDLLKAHPELLFPKDYETLISAAATKESLPPELILAIIRQESAFDPQARSSADAMGLMQILPEQAKNIAKELELSFEHFEDLNNPEFNIPIGTHLLKQNMDRYKGNLILAVAAYNANDRAIKNWLRTRFRDDPLEFVEEIPYEETRSYVKLVIRNYVFYKRLNQPTQSMTFPNECLTSLHNFKTSTDKDLVSR